MMPGCFAFCLFSALLAVGEYCRSTNPGLREASWVEMGETGFIRSLIWVLSEGRAAESGVVCFYSTWTLELELL